MRQNPRLRIDQVEDDVDLVLVRKEISPEQDRQWSDLGIGVVPLPVFLSVVAEAKAHGDPYLGFCRDSNWGW